MISKGCKFTSTAQELSRFLSELAMEQAGGCSCQSASIHTEHYVIKCRSIEFSIWQWECCQTQAQLNIPGQQKVGIQLSSAQEFLMHKLEPTPTSFVMKTRWIHHKRLPDYSGKKCSSQNCWIDPGSAHNVLWWKRLGFITTWNFVSTLPPNAKTAQRCKSQKYKPLGVHAAPNFFWYFLANNFCCDTVSFFLMNIDHIHHKVCET